MPLGSSAKWIRWKSGDAEVIWQSAQTLQTAQAVRVIFALPGGVLKAGTITVQPPRTEKEDAIHASEIGNVIKAAVVFRRRFWPKYADGIIHALKEMLPAWWNEPVLPAFMNKIIEI